MNKQSQSQPESNKEVKREKEAWKLPYLNANHPMPAPYQPKKKRRSSYRHEFDLNTNYISIPRYSALDDKNLVYFFDKTRNKKILEELKSEQSKKSKRKEGKTSKQTYTTRRREVSQTDFLDYLEKMKMKAKEKALIP